ncbi:hypothetical protein ACQ4PT_010249 [Festuca glaucescens]
MSLAAKSPSPSMSSLSDDDDFADLLATELELEFSSAADSASHGDPSASPASDDEEEEDVAVELNAIEQGSSKRHRVEEQHQDLGATMRPDEDAGCSFKDAQVKICPPHPRFIRGLCSRCGKNQDEDVSGVAFDYIDKGLRLGTSEMDMLCGSEVKNLLRERKLVLILDLDHTLINSTRLHDISPVEMDLGIQTAASKDVPNKSLFNLQVMHMLTKLRPFVRKFLEEASNMFEMYIYTMGDQAYAVEIAKLLDPGNVYFGS